MALNIPWDLFGKLFRNNISEFERRELDTWSDTSELNLNIYNEIINDECIKRVILSGTWENSALEWQNLLARIKPPKAKVTFAYNTLYWVSGTAAAILILVAVSVTLIYERSTLSHDKSAFTYIFSPRGQRTRVILPDQTRVWLNSESSLRYPVTYNQNERQVYLEGEGFFEVSKNARKPFFVTTHDLKVKVYGTSFNLKAYPDENTEASLIEGKLSVTSLAKASDEEIFLKPKEKLIFAKIPAAKDIPKAGITTSNKKIGIATITSIKAEAKVYLEKDADLENEMLWKEGKLIFYNETFEELAIKLERWYDVKIHFENEEIKKYRFTGMFDRETINQAMDALKVSSEHSFNYKMTLRDIYLQRKSR